jgi:hypothetical protein
MADAPSMYSPQYQHRGASSSSSSNGSGSGVPGSDSGVRMVMVLGPYPPVYCLGCSRGRLVTVTPEYAVPLQSVWQNGHLESFANERSMHPAQADGETHLHSGVTAPVATMSTS